MNCPYCNQPLSTKLSTVIYCTQCIGCPQFFLWEDLSATDLFLKHFLYFEVCFFAQHNTCYFNPNINQLYVSNLDKPFTLNYTLTPDNLLSTLERLNSLKAFL